MFGQPPRRRVLSYTFSNSEAAVDAATAFCASHGVNLVGPQVLRPGSLQRLAAVETATDALIAPEFLRREFFGHERLVSTLCRAVKPDPVALEYAQRVAGIATPAAAIKAKLSPNPPDISVIMGRITGLLDESITGQTIPDAGPAAIVPSKISFEALADRFKKSQHKNTDLEALKVAIRVKLDQLLRLNRTRADFAENFEALIESYNAGSRRIEQLFEELLKLSHSLDDEEERHVRENLSEEELVIFDILTRPAPHAYSGQSGHPFRFDPARHSRPIRPPEAVVKCGAQDRLMVLGNWGGIGGVRAEFSQGSSGQGDAVRVIDQSIQNRIAESGIPDAFMPVLERDLTGQECRASAGAIFDQFQEIPSFPIADRRQAPVVKDEQIGFAQLREQFAVRAVRAGDNEFG